MNGEICRWEGYLVPVRTVWFAGIMAFIKVCVTNNSRISFKPIPFYTELSLGIPFETKLFVNCSMSVHLSKAC
ncbi:hypothetical protein BU16DRAFT_49999 [Lophium mytilinum]|uniref:Uncharacterized protein n=1 Tax=Lophium mytilinum TaxID=390894 RepID=A0A6A6QS82_9PEZI|nr:hypothetical protein BU16DRAFT_49999 [Lophium mytilinum]